MSDPTVTTPIPGDLPRLDFKVPVGLEPGVVWTTCRRGTKWADRVAQGDFVAIAETDGEVLGKARVVELFVGPFRHAPTHYFANEHDPEARTFDGLLEVMRRAYDSSFDIDEAIVFIALETVATVQKPERAEDLAEPLNPEPQADGSPYQAEAEATAEPQGDFVQEGVDPITREAHANPEAPELTYNQARVQLGLNPVPADHPLADRPLAEVIGDEDASVANLRAAMREQAEA